MREIFFKDIKTEKLERIESLRDGCWINIENATKEDLEFVMNLTGFKFADLDDVFDPLELPRVERLNGSLLVFVRDVQHNSEISSAIYTIPLAIIVTGKYFITISLDKSDLIKSIIDSQAITFSTTQRSKFLIYILLSISKNFTKKVKSIRDNVLFQKKKFEEVESVDILNLVESEEILNNYVATLVPMKNVFEVIASGDYIDLYSYDHDLIQDMIISIRQSVDICTISIKSIRNLRESYEILFTNKLNRSIRLLTSLTVVLTIPTMIASIYGMNIGLPFENSPFAFTYVMIISVIVSLLITIILYKNKWF